MQAGEVRVTPVSGKKALAEFVDLPFRLYAHDPNWVPPLRMNQAELVGYKKHPFFQHADIMWFA